MDRIRRVVVVGLVAACALLGAACSRGSSSAPAPTVIQGPSLAAGEAPLRVELIANAMESLDSLLGGPQRYFEVNATPTLVNLFVATENTAEHTTEAVAYVFAAGELSDPSPPEPVKADAPTFVATDVVFDVERVLAPVVVALPLSQYRVFSVVGKVGGGVSYLINIESAAGGEMQIPVTGDGVITGVLQN